VWPDRAVQSGWAMPTRAILFAALITSACTTFHLPQVFLRGSFTPAVSRIGEDGLPATAGETFAFQAGLAGHLGETAAPTAPEEREEAPITPALREEAPCRVSAACAWERRAVAEARARVIGGAP
jgi:hypothetical protein